MFCDKCGKYNNDDNYYCEYCNKQLVHKVPTSAVRKLTILDCYKEFFKNAFNANGVANLLEINVLFITNIIIIVTFQLLNLSYISTLYMIITFIPFMTLICRRLHDTGKSGVFSIFYGLALICFMARAFFTKDSTVITFFVFSIIFFMISLLFLLRKTNVNSKYNPLNGYM